MPKRIIYISLFVILGVLMSFLLHALIEIPILLLLVQDFDTYGLGLTWNTWYLIHHVTAVLILLSGKVFGYRQGVRWWEIIYGGNRANKRT